MCYTYPMTEISAEDVRIPRRAREALARHEEVVVLNRERPAYIIVNPEDRSPARTHRGRPLHEALSLLADAAPADPAFVEDMEAVLEAIGPAPDDPWARS